MTPLFAILLLGVQGTLIFMAVYRTPSRDKSKLSGIDRFLDDIFFTRNVFFKVLFVFIVYGGYGVYFVQGYDWLPEDSIHRLLSTLQFPLCVGTFIFASASSPRLITPNTREIVEIEHFDLITCFPGTCKLCKIVKQPRSKHCQLCNQCVQRFDHHCVFLDVCVGAGNTHWFLSFAFVHWVLCVYGVYVLSSVFIVIQEEHGLYTLIDTETKELVTLFQRQQWIASNFTILWFLLLLLTILSIAVLFFLVYHVERVLFNMTTNEDVKRNKLKAALKHNKPINISMDLITVPNTLKDLPIPTSTPRQLAKKDVLDPTTDTKTTTLPSPNEWDPQFYKAALEHNIYTKHNLLENIKDALFYPISKK